ncbi:Chromosome transmission fidelity protein 18 -like protein [Toxocara canis]|uniref:Chromosome transmission fidelity protein 18-like protein n=1 Tax=Toxocara canis TaxID=6265 RepID=A0A0B2V3H4_TOXCA|nr:Chromosome transmission fidelity protein 18 -like protein [Toxocara canis]
MLNTTDESEFISVDNGKPRRPLQKVVLIAGAAGLGKTTLAGVVARHCGYRVVEMNASDDRNVLAFERKIEGAIRAVRTLDADSRPNCLVVDEIDGAPVESIRYLCKTLALTGRKAIRRPIICICNNLYVQTLRELRSVALVLQMPHTEQYRLERRLQQIADSEHVRIEAGAIAEIVSICALDMRSSINALQFIAIEKGCDVIGLNAVRTYGDRETRMGEKSLFDMWAYVFEMRRHIDNRGRLLDVPLRVRRVTALCQRFSTEFEKFHLGLFANYLSSGSECHRISSISAAARSFCDYDILSKLVLQSQNYELMKYTFVFIVQLHLLLASQERINLVFPTADQTCSQQRRQSVETLLSVRSGAAEKVIPERALVLDLLPMLVIIVQPPLKPMNMQLYSDRELNMLRAVVAVMRSYSLTFAATFHDGVTSFTFCPPVDALVLFPLEDCERRRANFLSNSVRQMIAHQIELNKLRSDVVQSEKENGRRIEQESVSGKGATGNRSVTAAYELSQYNSSNRGRGIVYRYNQGFSNAIRRNIRMKNLIF